MRALQLLSGLPHMARARRFKCLEFIFPTVI